MRILKVLVMDSSSPPKLLYRREIRVPSVAECNHRSEISEDFGPVELAQAYVEHECQATMWFLVRKIFSLYFPKPRKDQPNESARDDTPRNESKL